MIPRYLLASIISASLLCAYQADTSTIGTVFDQLVKKAVGDIKDARNSSSSAGQVANVVRGNRLLFLYGVASSDILRDFLSEIEEKRLDKQVGGSAGTPGSSSLVSKGSVPSLIGLAVENGGLTQTQSGTVITLRGNVAGLIKSLAKQNYLDSAITDQSDWGQQALNKLSGSVSFDINQGNTPGVFTGEGNQISGYSVHFDIRNRRDPRNKEYRPAWISLRDIEQQDFNSKLTPFSGAISGNPTFEKWVADTRDLLLKADDANLETVLRTQLTAFKTNVFPVLVKDAGVKAAYDAAVKSLDTFAGARVNLVNKAVHSLIVSTEYVEVRQPTVAATATMVAQPLPELGTFRLIAQGHFIGQSEITANASFTTFNKIPSGVNTGRFRDWQLSLQTVTPIKSLIGIGQPTLTFAAAFVHLMETPLGAAVTVNGISQTTPGNIGYAQTKLEFPIKGTGLKLPIALTYGSRDELLKNEKNKFGANIGLTFDLDKLFAKSK